MDSSSPSTAIDKSSDNMTSDLAQSSLGWIDPNVKSLDCHFQYERLRRIKSFRVLKLLPSSDPTSLVECSLLEQSMEEPVLKYYALSYVWGETQGKQEIVLNGRPAFVTKSLHEALLQLRNVPGLLGDILKPLHLWIDALCINQQDNDEKRWQVRFMRDKIGRASCRERVFLSV